jgi:hypothetical protein
VNVNRASNAVRSGGSTTTAVAAGSSAPDFANAITASGDNAVSLARRTRNASSMAASLLWAAWCRIFR